MTVLTSLHVRQRPDAASTTSRRTRTSSRSTSASASTTITQSTPVIATTSQPNISSPLPVSPVQPERHLPLGAIAGGMGAGLAIALAAVVAFWCWSRSARRQKALEQGRTKGILVAREKTGHGTLSTPLGSSGLSFEPDSPSEEKIKSDDDYPSRRESHRSEVPTMAPSRPRRLTKLHSSHSRVHFKKTEGHHGVLSKPLPPAHPVTPTEDAVPASPSPEETTEIAALIPSVQDTTGKQPKHHLFTVHSTQRGEKRQNTILSGFKLGSLREEPSDPKIMTDPCRSSDVTKQQQPSSGWIARLPRRHRLRPTIGATPRHRISSVDTPSAYSQPDNPCVKGLTPKASTVSSASWYSTQSAEEHQKRVHPSFILAALGHCSDGKEAPVSPLHSSWGGPSRLSQVSAVTAPSQHGYAGASIGVAIGGEEQV